MAKQTYLARALAVRAISRGTTDQERHGAALATLRADAMMGVHDHHEATLGAQAIYDEIMGIEIGDMPPDPDLVAIMLETAAQRHGGISHAMIWESHVGISKTRGRDLLARNADRLDWPIWKVLRDVAFEPIN